MCDQLKAKMHRLKMCAVRTLFGPSLDSKMRPLLKAKGHPKWEFSAGNALTTTLITGSTESGKTTKMKVVLLAMMRARFGGIALVVKPSLTNDVRDIAILSGREHDLIFLRADGNTRYNPFELTNTAAEGAALLAEVAKAIQTKAPDGVSEDKFWSELRDVQLRKLCEVCLHAHSRLSIPDLAKLYQALPNSPDQRHDLEWQKNSTAWPILQSALNAKQEEVQRSAHFLLNRPSAAHSKLQDSINALISVLLDRLDSAPLNRVFVGDATFGMEDVLNRQKVLVVDMPLLESDSGRIANLLVQHCFMKAATRINRHGECFLLCDEFHHTVTPDFATFISHQREAKIAPVLVTQNLLLLEERIGKISTLALCGNAVTKIFCRQDDPTTNEWASGLVGKGWKWRHSETRGYDSGRSISSHKELDHFIHSHEFATLPIAEAIVLREGTHWKTRWPNRPDGKNGTVKIVSG